MVFPFVYKMYKNNMISKEFLYKNLNLCNFDNEFFISWFLPEIMEANPEKYKEELEPQLVKEKKSDDPNRTKNGSNIWLTSNTNYQNVRKALDFSKSKDNKNIRRKSNVFLFKPCNIEHLEEYKEMRDRCEDDDEITKLIRNDDVDKFQSIVSQSGDQILKKKANINMFETCIFKKPISYLNYAAAYGSIKCFKYMILNDQQIDELTFSMAIIGGNSELIRIVDNKEAENQKSKRSSYFMSFKQNKHMQIELALSQSIKRHKYELSDWILDQKIETLLSKNINLVSLFFDSIKSANIYAFTKMIDNELDLISCKDSFTKFLACISKKGYFSYLKYLMKLMSNYIKPDSINTESMVSACNIYIYKFFEAHLSQKNLCSALISSISAKFEKLINELIESFISKKIDISSDNLYNLLKEALTHYSDDFLFYLMEKANILCKFDSDLLESLLPLKKECKYYIKIADIIYQNLPTNDFTRVLYRAADLRLTELMKHIISKNYLVNYSFYNSKDLKYLDNRKNGLSSSSSSSSKTTFDVDMFDLIMTNVDSDSQQILLYYINNAIKYKNIPLVQYLLDKNAPLEDALITASSGNNLELVEMILKKNSEPSYINKCSLKGSALTIAAKYHNLNIVNRLLSIPGIDPNVLDGKYNTALIISAENGNAEIFNALLTFYGNDILNQKWQLEKSIIALSDTKKNGSESISKDKSSLILLKILDTNCIDPNFHLSNTNLLSYAINNNYIDVVKKLLQFDVIDVNAIDPSTGNTPIFSAINRRTLEIFQLLAGHPKINLNYKNYTGYSVLEYAVLYGTIKFVELILKNEKFIPNENEINHAFYNSKNFEISKLFVDFKSLDVNFIPINDYDSKYTNVNNKEFIKSSLMKAIENDDDKLFDLIIQHPSFKIIKSELINSILIAFKCNSIPALRKLIGLYNKTYHDINAPVFNGNSLLVEAAIQKAGLNAISLILDDPNFDSKKSDIFKAFVLCCSANKKENQKKFRNDEKIPINILDRLYNYDINHDKLIYDKINEKGSTVLSHVYTNLLKSDNPNLIVQDAIQNDSYISFISAINSTKCDLSSEINENKAEAKSFNFYGPRKNQALEIKSKTLFHLAAFLGREKILNEIVSKHLVDVNIKNKDGETALMVACKNKKIESVKILFKADDLDFYYRNKNGQDALEILQIAKGLPSKSGEIKGKDEYLSALLDLMVESQSKDKQFENPKQRQKLNTKQGIDQSTAHAKQSNLKEKSSDAELNHEITLEYGSIKFNGQSPSFNKSSKVKLEFHNESFTEKPKSSLQNHVSCLQPEMKARRRIRDEIFMNERMMPNFTVDQNQMILLQQQQQRWFQMIQMNNEMQAQINMKMMNQVNINQNQSKKKKRNKK